MPAGQPGELGAVALGRPLPGEQPDGLEQGEPRCRGGAVRDDQGTIHQSLQQFLDPVRVDGRFEARVRAHRPDGLGFGAGGGALPAVVARGEDRHPFE